MTSTPMPDEVEHHHILRERRSQAFHVLQNCDTQCNTRAGQRNTPWVGGHSGDRLAGLQTPHTLRTHTTRCSTCKGSMQLGVSNRTWTPHLPTKSSRMAHHKTDVPLRSRCRRRRHVDTPTVQASMCVKHDSLLQHDYVASFAKKLHHLAPPHHRAPCTTHDTMTSTTTWRERAYLPARLLALLLSPILGHEHVSMAATGRARKWIHARAWAWLNVRTCVQAQQRRSARGLSSRSREAPQRSGMKHTSCGKGFMRCVGRRCRPLPRLSSGPTKRGHEFEMVRTRILVPVRTLRTLVHG